MSTMTPELRAERLLRWYPAIWRDRYGEEFAELLVAEIQEQPESFRRTADVAASGIFARLTVAGLRRGAITEPATMLATIGCIVAACYILGVSVWAQLATGTATSSGSIASHLGLMGLTGSLGYLAIVAIAAVAPTVGPAVRGLRSRPEIRRPLIVMALSATALVVGGIHLGAHWRAGGGTLSDRIAGFGWAETWSINTAWAHPTALPLMHPARLAWMLLSPIALAAIMASAVTVLQRLELSARTIRYESRVTAAAVLGLVPMLISAAVWVLTSQHDADVSLRAGTLDLALVVVMFAAVVTARITSRRVAVALNTA